MTDINPAYAPLRPVFPTPPSIPKSGGIPVSPAPNAGPSAPSGKPFPSSSPLVIPDHAIDILGVTIHTRYIIDTGMFIFAMVLLVVGMLMASKTDVQSAIKQGIGKLKDVAEVGAVAGA